MKSHNPNNPIRSHHPNPHTQYTKPTSIPTQQTN